MFKKTNVYHWQIFLQIKSSLCFSSIYIFILLDLFPVFPSYIYIYICVYVCEHIHIQSKIYVCVC